MKKKANVCVTALCSYSPEREEELINPVSFVLKFAHRQIIISNSMNSKQFDTKLIDKR